MDPVNFKVLIQNMRSVGIKDISFIEPDKILIKDTLIEVDYIFLKTNTWKHVFRNANQILNIFMYEGLFPKDLRLKNTVLFYYDLHSLSKENIIKQFNTPDYLQT